MDWINIDDRLPELHKHVALMDTNRYANNGSLTLENEHVVQVGFLNDWGEKYWSVYGERGMSLNAFTHWHPLPEPPK